MNQIKGSYRNDKFTAMKYYIEAQKETINKENLNKWKNEVDNEKEYWKCRNKK